MITFKFFDPEKSEEAAKSVIVSWATCGMNGRLRYKTTNLVFKVPHDKKLFSLWKDRWVPIEYARANFSNLLFGFSQPTEL